MVEDIALHIRLNNTLWEELKHSLLHLDRIGEILHYKKKYYIS